VLFILKKGTNQPRMIMCKITNNIPIEKNYKTSTTIVVTETATVSKELWDNYINTRRKP